MNTLQHIGLTRDSVARLAIRFSTPRIDVADPDSPAGKRSDTLRTQILQALDYGPKTTPEIQWATDVGKETLRSVMRQMEEMGKIRKVSQGKGGKHPVQAVWEVVR